MADQVQPEAPREAERIVRHVLDALAARSAFRTPRLSLADPRTLALASPHRVVVLPLEVLRAGREIRLVERGWRFLITSDGEAIAAAEALAQLRGRFRFGGLNEGPLVTGFATALRSNPGMQEPGVETRLLLAPALHVAAVVITQAGAPGPGFRTRDTIIPIVSAHPRLPPFRVIPPVDYVAILRMLAAEIPVDGAKGG
ncbi:hypothetical protein [Methylobacterium platani]|uniref:Uncharacterized protein n=2 Tax=Methylobacterium platani TaxID=427683 RepID=A0A179RY62_9HYPH|nr:hypothetical protein [Methylobacterium platani]KMO10722.1 hypothetical protein SQ03_29200 [Methylobacterium platani JCM 14648]OAS15859.1 hypothetical protein A5481_29170 [Methylobacterium platani]